MAAVFLFCVFLASCLLATPATCAADTLYSNGTYEKLPGLPKYLTGGGTPLPQGYPWGYAGNDPLKGTPNTGVVRSYEWTITRGFIAPDGVNTSALLVNNQFPGPPLEANWGDTFQITVHNRISGPEEGTTLHWHGILHRETQWMDGVPSISQCPIAPGKSFTYTFKADQYGTSWYHSHYSAQYTSGLVGAMVIYGPRHVEYDIDLGPVMLSDHFHEDYKVSIEKSSGIPFELPFSQSNLINGKMFYDCSLLTNGQSCTPNAEISKFRFQTGKTHLLRLINTGAEGLQYFSIDDHVMTVIANDCVPIEPYTTDGLTVGIAQRYDVLVQAKGKPSDAVWMRSNISTVCSLPEQPAALAAIYYDRANESSTPQSTSTTSFDNSNCNNEDLAKNVPFYPATPPSAPATTQEIEVVLGVNASGNSLFFMNNISFRGNYDNPILLLAKLGNTSYPDDPQWNVYNFGSNSSIRLILRNMGDLAHPIHLHGHNFWVLAEGRGEWDGTVVNPKNPPRRDVQIMRGATSDAPGYLVMEYETDNPGAWPLHCHIAWHISTGLAVTVLERPDDITGLNIPATVAQTCRDWADYSGHNVVDQIDSGL